MDETGLDVPALSLTTPALHDLGVAAIDLARRANAAAAAGIAHRPDRFQALAALSVDSPHAAARESRRCVRDLGFQGRMPCGRVGARNLDHPGFRPIFAAVRRAHYEGFAPAVEAAFAMVGLTDPSPAIGGSLPAYRLRPLVHLSSCARMNRWMISDMRPTCSKSDVLP